VTINRLLAWLLWRANAHPTPVRRNEFYALKDRLLRRLATRLPDMDVQHIVRECWGPLGGLGCSGQGCYRCGGSGVWSEAWVLLERWDFAGYVFHRPAGRTGPRPATIEGFVRHPGGVDARMAEDALLWLALLCDRRLFWRTLRGSRSCGSTRRPMLLLQKLVFEIRLCVDRWHPRTCGSCGRSFIRPFEGPGIWLICRRCWRPHASVVPVAALVHSPDWHASPDAAAEAVVSEYENLRDDDTIQTLLNLARTGRERDFRDLAAMVGVEQERIDELWLGTKARRCDGPQESLPF
jgi:hypothetical protein